MEITVPQGTHAAYLAASTKRQMLDDELVIDRRHQLRVTNVLSKPGKPLIVKAEVLSE